MTTFAHSLDSLPLHARAVIIGGGVGGTSIAYHLTQLGWRDIVLLDRADLTSGSTFHSAGLVGQLRSSVSLTKMLMYSVDLYRRLRAETDADPGWREVGSLRLASTPTRMEELRRQAGWARTFGLPLEVIGPEEAQRLFPPLSIEGVLGAVYLPTDGYLDPSGLALALARGARQGGAAIFTHTRVLAINLRESALARSVQEIVTDRGTIKTEVVINAGGMFAPEIGRLAGVNVPIIPMEHQYLITGPLPDSWPQVTPSMPTLRDPDHLVYFRPELHGLAMGGYERNPVPWSLDGIPPDFNGKLLAPDWDRFASIMEGAVHRVPGIEAADVTRFINGPEGFTPDGEFILGESEVRGFYVAAGFCAHGIAGAGGMGKMMAEWVVDGAPSLDLWHMDIRRFGRQYRSRQLALARTLEVYSTYYDIRYPSQEKTSERGLRLSPAYSRLCELHAEFGEKSGWERVNWFNSNAPMGDEALRPRGWAGQVWSPAIEVECRAARGSAALFDETSFSKIEVNGPGVVDFLQYLCDNEIDRPVGSVVYTQMLNPKGGIECDVTVTRLSIDRFRIITGTAYGTHDLGWIRSHQPDDGSVQITDVTSNYACLGLWGPLARQIVQSVTTDDLSNAGFPYLTAREISIGSVPCLAVRVTYVGELGWEFYCPTEYGQRLWDTLWQAGQPYGLVAGGYRAIESLRLEKGYRVWSYDITPETTPDEAGLSFCVRVKKRADFIGRSALLAQREQGPPARRLCCLVLGDPLALALGGEPVRYGEQIVGRVTSGGYGYLMATSIAYAYLPSLCAQVGAQIAVEIFGEWIAGEVVVEPLWDLKNERIKA